MYHCLIHTSHVEALCSPSPESTHILQLNTLHVLHFMHFTVFHNFHLFLNPSPFFPSLYLRGNPTHPKTLHYNVTSFLMLSLVTLSCLFQKAVFSSSFITLLSFLLCIKYWLVFWETTLFICKLGGWELTCYRRKDRVLRIRQTWVWNQAFHLLDVFPGASNIAIWPCFLTWKLWI